MSPLLSAASFWSFKLPFPPAGKLLWYLRAGPARQAGIKCCSLPSRTQPFPEGGENVKGKKQSHFEKTNTTYKSLKGSEVHIRVSKMPQWVKATWTTAPKKLGSILRTHLVED